jgi:hypothetical protein
MSRTSDLREGRPDFLKFFGPPVVFQKMVQELDCGLPEIEEIPDISEPVLAIALYTDFPQPNSSGALEVHR